MRTSIHSGDTGNIRHSPHDGFTVSSAHYDRPRREMGCQSLRGELTSAPRPRSAFGRAHAEPTDRGADGVKAVAAEGGGASAPALRPPGRRATPQHSCSVAEAGWRESTTDF